MYDSQSDFKILSIPMSIHYTTRVFSNIFSKGQIDLSSTFVVHLFPIAYRIEEELPVGTLIGNLFKDVKRLYEEFQLSTIPLYSIKQMQKFELTAYDTNSQQSSDFFKLDQQTGNLFIQSSIDYEAICPKPIVYSTSSPSSSTSSSSSASSSLTRSFLSKTISNNLSDNLKSHELTSNSYDCLLKLILFVSLNNSIDERWIPIIFHIEDINDNRPIFLEASSSKWSGFYSISIQENIPIGTKLPLVKAFDRDTDLKNSEIIYKLNYQMDANSRTDMLNKQNFDKIFSLTSCHNNKKTQSDNKTLNNLPCLLIKDELNYESQQKYIFQLIAYIFPSENYHVVNISENLPTGTLILKIEAKDEDSEANSRLTYTLTQNTFRQEIFTGLSNSVSINSHGNEDSHKQINSNSQFFSINPKNGEIRLNKILNAHETPQIEITFHVSDNGSPIHKVSQRSHVGFVVISDDDLGENGQVSCIHKLEDYHDNWSRYSNLKINLVNNGQISNRYLYTLQVMREGDTSVFDANISLVLNNKQDNHQHRRNSVHKLTSTTMVITCKDYGSPSALTSSISLTISLTDIQQTDLCFEQNTYKIILEESNRPLMSILRPQLLDLVTGVKFSLHSKDMTFNNGCDQLEIDSFTGEISAPNGIDREKSALVYCIMRASVHDNTIENIVDRTADTEILINVTDINDNEPRLVGESLVYGFTIHEWDRYADDTGATASFSSNDHVDDTNPYVVGFLKAVDQDFGENGTVKYFILKVTGEKNQAVAEMKAIFNHHNDEDVIQHLKPSFQVNSSTGLISLPRSDHKLINWEDINTYTLQILVEDMGYPTKLTSIQTVKIYVTDVNDNPPIWLHTISSSRVQMDSFKEITLYQLEPIWEINQNSPTELRTVLKAYDFDYGDNSKLIMRIIQPNSIYKEFIGSNKFNLPLNCIRISMNGEIQLDIDRLDGSQDYVVFIRVQDQGVQRQLYTDGYFFIHLPIQTKNKLNLPIDLLINSLINTTSDYRNDNNEHEKLQKSTNHNSGLYELKIIIVLIISFSLIIILSTIMLFIIISKCRKNKRRKGRNIQRGYIQKTSEEYTTHEAMNGIQGLEKQEEHQQQSNYFIQNNTNDNIIITSNNNAQDINCSKYYDQILYKNSILPDKNQYFYHLNDLIIVIMDYFCQICLQQRHQQ
ncbi:unnamed protein product [Heterobilharzia americana]|nr:unnamed protein product [Heterobilharzia americana]